MDASGNPRSEMIRPARRVRRGDATGSGWLPRPLTESTREREVYRNLESWSRAYDASTLHRLAFPANDKDAMPKPEGCADTALAALAQLGALRLGVRRCLVTLISSDLEFVLAEATRTMSLQYDTIEDSNDQAWLGTSSFMRVDGLNAIAVDEWRRARQHRAVPEGLDHYYTEGWSPHWCIFSDARSHPEYKERQFVRRASLLRFYCSVPLRNTEGTVLGSFTIMDDKPRFGVSAFEMSLLEDMADTVAHHLNGAVVASQRHRSERLIQGLAAFNKGQHSLREWWKEHDIAQGQRGGRHADRSIDPVRQAERLEQEMGKQDLRNSVPPSMERRANREKAKIDGNTPGSMTTINNAGAASNRTAEAVSMEDFGGGQPSKPSQAPTFVGEQTSITGSKHAQPSRQALHRGQHSYSSLAATSSTFELAEALKEAFGRASNLIREAVNAEAVVVVDANLASRKAARMRRPSESEDRDTSTQSSNVEQDLQSPTSDDSDTSQGSARSPKACKIRGFSTRNRTSLDDGTSAHNFKFSPDDMAKLIRRYPRGKVFHFHKEGELASSSGEEATGESQGEKGMSKTVPRQRRDQQKLGKVMVGARTALFYPLWESDGERCHSGIFLWSTNPMRFFDEAEVMLYLSAFGHSLQAELIRLDTLAADQAKGTFISSVSHELRSPLHGVLAGVELLQDSELSGYQKEMAHMIAMAGRTLLDTVNHILDYSKISSSARGQRKLRITEEATRHPNASVVDQEGNKATTHIDLAILTEEVIESAVAAYRYRTFTKADLHPNDAQDSSDEITSAHLPRGLTKSPSAISVIVDIAWRRSWVVEMSPGSWTRILTNLVGNSLKYTTSGTISVRMEVIEVASLNDRPTSMIKLSVKDTGIGMSEQFLANSLYVPFSQQDTHSVGTGLGLSIVKKLANEIDGHLNVSSELGKGTRITLEYNTTFSEATVDRQLDEKPEGMQLGRVKLLDVRREIEGEDFTGNGFSDTPLGVSFATMAEKWLNCDVDGDGSINDVGPDYQLCVVSESDFYLLYESKGQSLVGDMQRLAKQGTQFLVLGDSVRSTFTKFVTGRFSKVPLFVNQPIGPRKVMSSILQHNDSTTPLDVGDFAIHDIHQTGNKRPTYARKNSSQRAATTPLDRPTSKGRAETPQRLPKPMGVPSSTSSGYLSPKSSAERTEDRPARTQVPAPQTTAGSRVASAGGKRGSSVLLVEDNAINMKLLVALMGRMKLDYDTAENGLLAVKAYTADPMKYALILMDMSMPTMDGFTATTKIREVESEEELPRCMIVALTGVTSSDATERAHACGVDRYFTKPIRMKALSDLWDDITSSAGSESMAD